MVRQRINWIEVVDAPGHCTRPGRVHKGQNSGYQSIECGMQWCMPGARGVLLGFDMQRTGGKSHCNGDHKGGLPNLGDLPDWCRRMGELSVDLRRLGIEILNATRITALTCFERVTLEDALNRGNG